MGDGVNIAARLEGVNKEYGTRLCISHSVFKEAGERLCVRPIEDVVVKGRRSSIPIYELLGTFAGDPAFEPGADTLKLCKMTRHAYQAVVAGERTLALQRYREILVLFPNDAVASTLARRLGSA
jgi:adenylate cyclase